MHIVFALKYRRKVFFEEKRLEIREILRTLCAWKGVDIIEGEICQTTYICYWGMSSEVCRECQAKCVNYFA